MHSGCDNICDSLILVGLSFELKHLFDGGEYPFLFGNVMLSLVYIKRRIMSIPELQQGIIK